MRRPGRRANPERPDDPTPEPSALGDGTTERIIAMERTRGVAYPVLEVNDPDWMQAGPTPARGLRGPSGGGPLVMRRSDAR